MSKLLVVALKLPFASTENLLVVPSEFKPLIKKSVVELSSVTLVVILRYVPLESAAVLETLIGLMFVTVNVSVLGTYFNVVSAETAIPDPLEDGENNKK